MYWIDILSPFAYFLIFLGVLLEGEVSLILGGFLANNHGFSLTLIILIGIIASVIHDQAIFRLGKSKLSKYLPEKKMNFLSSRLENLKSHHLNIFLTFVRFFYGIRIFSIVMLSRTNIKQSKFLKFNIIGSILWSISIAFIGYLFGLSLGIFLKRVSKFEVSLILLIIGISLLLILFRIVVRKISLRKV